MPSRQDVDAVEMIWQRVASEYPNVPPTHLGSRLRDAIESALDRHLLFCSDTLERVWRETRGRRGFYPPDVLDVQHRTHRDRDGFVLDLFVVVGDPRNPICLRHQLRQDGTLRRSGVHEDPRSKERRLPEVDAMLRADQVLFKIPPAEFQRMIRGMAVRSQRGPADRPRPARQRGR